MLQPLLRVKTPCLVEYKLHLKHIFSINCLLFFLLLFLTKISKSL